MRGEYLVYLKVILNQSLWKYNKLMYVCKYVYMYVCKYVYMYVSMCICMYVSMYICMYVCMDVCMYCIYVCMYFSAVQYTGI